MAPNTNDSKLVSADRDTSKDAKPVADQSADNPPALGEGEHYDEAPNASESDADFDAPEQNAKEVQN